MSIVNIIPLGRPPWPTIDPFYFAFTIWTITPAANPDMSPKASLLGRNIGSDFSQKMVGVCTIKFVPGFPSHPHRF